MQTSTELRKLLAEALIREAKERNESPPARYDWTPDPTKITREQTIELRAAHTMKGYNRAKLASLGVPWPPPNNWKGRLISAAVEYHGISDLRGEAKKIQKHQELSKSWPVFSPPKRREFKKHVPRTREEVIKAKTTPLYLSDKLDKSKAPPNDVSGSFTSVSDLLKSMNDDSDSDSPPW